MKYLPLAARICLSLIFFKAGITHIMGFESTQTMMTERGLPVAGLLLLGTVVFQLLGALSLLLGYQVKIGSTLLIIFLIPATLVFHNFISDPEQINNFLKNIGLIGGLLMVIYTGAGSLSLDEYMGDRLHN
jgi:putative oxidoreductase